MIVIRSGRHPHEVMFLISLLIVGVAGLVASQETTNAVLRQLHPVARVSFYAVLAVGTTLSLIGVFSKGLKGPAIELVGLSVFALQLLSYSGAVIAYAGPVGLFSASFPLCMGIGNVWRVFQILREMREARIGEAATPRPSEGS